MCRELARGDDHMWMAGWARANPTGIRGKEECPCLTDEVSTLAGATWVGDVSPYTGQCTKIAEREEGKFR